MKMFKGRLLLNIDHTNRERHMIIPFAVESLPKPNYSDNVSDGVDWRI